MELWLPTTPDGLFALLSDARHLHALTPPWLAIRILTPGPVAMAPGVCIEYDIRLRGLPIRWCTEITTWEPPRGFAERQSRGPFLAWTQVHELIACDGGTLLEERMEYRVPGGALVDMVLVRPELERVFTYRAARLAEHFARGSSAARG